MFAPLFASARPVRVFSDDASMHGGEHAPSESSASQPGESSARGLSDTEESAGRLGEAEDTAGRLGDIARQLRAFGASEREIDHALSRGEPQRAVLEIVARHSAAGRTTTPAEIEAAGGPSVERLGELMQAFGLAPPGRDEHSFTPAEARAMVEIWRSSDVWPFELAVQISRVYGRLLARIAHATVQLWASVVEPVLRERGAEDGALLAGAESLERLLPVSDALLMAVHRRWLEREATQMAFQEVPLSRHVGGALASVEVSFLFCDLKDFTAFADRQGDDAAVRIIDRFAAVVTREQGPEARLTKLLGDGFMCSYPNPALAVAAGARIIDAMAAPGGPDVPGVHASVHHGLAIPREGDYFGASVNLTARLLAFADRDQLVATRSVLEHCSNLEWERAGTLRIRGISDEVEVFRLKR
jgi:class 3 adenylate cyclase